MADFIPTAGYENCPKCGGWQVLDTTIRKKNGWPIGPVVMIDCDHCQGAGQIKLDVEPKPIVIRDNRGLILNAGWGAKPLEPGPVQYETPAYSPKPVDTVKEGWASFDE